MKTLLLVIAMLISVNLAYAKTTSTISLPKPEEVFVIAVDPASLHTPLAQRYFTPESMQQMLPQFKLGEAELKMGTKRVWQSGVIVLKNKKVLFWTTCRKNFIHILTPEGYVSFIIGDGNDNH